MPSPSWIMRRSKNCPCNFSLAAVLIGATVALRVPAQNLTALSAPSATAKSWAAECAKNEEQVIHHPGSYLRYRLHEVDQKGDQLRDLIETPEGTVARLIKRGGKPLTPEQDAAERARLNAMLTSPDDFARHVRRDNDARKTGIDLLRAMPDAMSWNYAADQPQLSEHRVGEPPLIVLDFKPDPKWSPPSLEAEALTGLEGRVWIDPQSRRVVHLEATVFRAVNVGWGVLAHVYPGGSVRVDQVAVVGDRWIVRNMAQQFTVRALLVKSVRQQAVTNTSEYRAVPEMSYQQAIKILLDTPLPQN